MNLGTDSNEIMCHSGFLTDTNPQVQNYCAAEQALSKKPLSPPAPSHQFHTFCWNHIDMASYTLSFHLVIHYGYELSQSCIPSTAFWWTGCLWSSLSTGCSSLLEMDDYVLGCYSAGDRKKRWWGGRVSPKSGYMLIYKLILLIMLIFREDDSLSCAILWFIWTMLRSG